MSVFEDEKKCTVVLDDIADLTEADLHALRDNRNFYNLLGVPDDATGDTISAHYKAKALRLHPDKHPHSPFLEAFKQAFENLALAKRTLTDPQLRRQYDLARGSSTVKRKFSYEALQERRKVADDDYRKIEYDVHLQAQLQRAQIYQDEHEAEQIFAYGLILGEAKRHVLSEMRKNNWDIPTTATYASTHVGKYVSPGDLQSWIDNEHEPEPEGVSRKELEGDSELIDRKGRFKGFGSYKELATYYAVDKEKMQGEVEIAAGAGDGMKAAIMRAREEREKEKQAKLQAEEEAAAKVQAEKKRAREEQEEALQSQVTKRARIDTTEGFAQIVSNTKKNDSTVTPKNSLSATLNMLKADNSDSDSDSGSGEQGLGLLGGYQSD